MKPFYYIVMISCFLASACSNSNNRRLTVIFDRVDHLEIGSKVYMKGLLIGEVIVLDLADKGVLAKIKIEKDVNIPKGSTFLIDPSLFGNASIIVEPSGQQIYLTSNDTSLGQYVDKKVLDHVVSDTAKSRKLQQSLDKIGEGIKELLETSGDTTSHIY